MPVDVTLVVDETSLDKIRRLYARRHLKAPMSQYRDVMLRLVFHGAQAAIKTDTRKAHGRMKMRPIGEDNGKVWNDATYAAALHEGSKPHWPPPGALAGWARRKGIPEFLAQRAIAEKGTKANPFLTLGLKDARKKMPREVQITAGRVETSWTKET